MSAKKQRSAKPATTKRKPTSMKSVLKDMAAAEKKMSDALKKI